MKKNNEMIFNFIPRENCVNNYERKKKKCLQQYKSQLKPKTILKKKNHMQYF